MRARGEGLEGAVVCCGLLLVACCLLRVGHADSRPNSSPLIAGQAELILEATGLRWNGLRVVGKAWSAARAPMQSPRAQGRSA